MDTGGNLIFEVSPVGDPYNVTFTDTLALRFDYSMSDKLVSKTALTYAATTGYDYRTATYVSRTNYLTHIETTRTEYLIRTVTYSTAYLTRVETSRTEYLTSVKTVDIGYKTGPETYTWEYKTRSSIYGYSGVSSSSQTTSGSMSYGEWI